MIPKRNRHAFRGYHCLPRKLRISLVHFGSYWLFHLMNLPFLPLAIVSDLLLRLYYRVTAIGEFNGIRIVSSRRGDSSFFLQATKDALTLIERYDARRFRTIQREVRYIENAYIDSIGRYERHLLVCMIDFSHFKNEHFAPQRRGTDEYFWYVAYYAAVLVHEATHGRLYSLGIPYTKKTRLRSEQLCQREEERFAAHLPNDIYNFARDLVAPFSSEPYERLWNRSLYDALKWAIQKIGEIIKNRPDSDTRA